jgi:hypothetical protein
MKQQRHGRVAVAALALVAGLVTAGCTSDDSGEPQREPEAEATSSQPPVKVVPLKVGVGQVTGDLPRPRRMGVARGVATAVDAWFEAAYLGGSYPRTNFNRAFPAFTDGATQRAKHDRALTTNAAIGAQTDEVTPRLKTVTVDLLSPRRRPAGATARFRLVYDTAGQAAYTVQVTGRLMLTRTKNGGWQIFGYDVARNAMPRQGGRS